MAFRARAMRRSRRSKKRKTFRQKDFRKPWLPGRSRGKLFLVPLHVKRFLRPDLCCRRKEARAVRLISRSRLTGRPTILSIAPSSEPIAHVPAPQLARTLSRRLPAHADSARHGRLLFPGCPMERTILREQKQGSVVPTLRDRLVQAWQALWAAASNLSPRMLLERPARGQRRPAPLRTPAAPSENHPATTVAEAGLLQETVVLTKIQAEEFLDWLEANGVEGREVICRDGGFVVRHGATKPR